MANSGVARNNKIIFLVIAILMGAVFAGSLSFFNNVYETEVYYRLNQDVPTRTQLTPEMFDKVETSAGTAPEGALTIADVQNGFIFTRYPLRFGEVVNGSAVGGLDDISVGIPDSWVVTSFSVPADNAVGGRIQRGIYFDMMVVTETGVFYPFVNILALDTSISLSGATNANAVNTEESKSGQTSFYYVGMSPEDAALLQSLVRQYSSNIQLILSPRENEYQAPNLDAYTADDGLFAFDAEDFEIKNMSPGTNNTFTDVERDAFGRPAERDSNGNVLYPIKCGNSFGSVVDSASECEQIDNTTFGNDSAE